MILVVQDWRAAGAEYGRPPTPTAPGFWELNEDYLKR
jgi:hypothetical protein